MADKKISQLTTLVQADVVTTADFVPIVDTSAVETKKVTPQALVQAGATGATLALADGAAATPSLTNTGDENTGIFFPAADTIAFSEGGVESMRLDSSGNLGIGTSSPGAKIHAVNSTPNSGRPTLFLDSNYGNTGDSVASIRATVNNNAGGTYIWGLSSESILAHNTEFISGSNWVARSTTASYLSQAGGIFTFFSNQSLTAGNSFTPTERMRLDSSGNLGIGTSSPGEKLEVTGNIRALNSGANSQVIATAPTDSFSPFIRWGVSGIRDSGILGYPAGDDALVYRSGANSFSTGTERFRITAVGNVVAGGSAALATTATNGFLYVPTCAGTPTGTPTAITGMAPIVVNTTNNKLYFYSGGAWRDAGP
jgi:hypothetical protein